MPALADDPGGTAVVPRSLEPSVPTSSFTGSFMCQTLRYPLDSLNTAGPLDSLAASALPQCSLISCRALPLMTGMRTQMLAVPFAASHSSIW